MFNEKQLEFINTLDGRVALISVAGSGKTSSTIERIKNIVKYGVQPERILATSFTKAGAEALDKKLSKQGIRGVKSCTIHSLAYGIVTSQDPSKAKKLIPSWKTRSCLFDLYKGLGLKEKDFKEQNIIGSINIQQGHMLRPDDELVEREEFELGEELIRYFYQGYEDYKKQNDLIDFNDMIFEAIDIINKRKRYRGWDYVIIDEAQDISLLQWALVQKVCPKGNIALVGDFQQAIYSFNSGDQKIIMDYYKNFDNVKVINMNTNYRSGSEIIKNCNRLTKYWYGDYKYYTETKVGRDNKGLVAYKDFDSPEEESLWVFKQIKKKIEEGTCLNDMAVIYRNNKMSQHIEALLKKSNIDYTITGGGSIFAYKEIQTICAILRLIESDFKDDLAMNDLVKARVIQAFKFLPNADIDNINYYSKSSGKSLFQSFYADKYRKPSTRGQVITALDNIIDIVDRFGNDSKIERILKAIISRFEIEKIIDREDAENREGKKLALELVLEKCGNMRLEEAITFLSEGGDSKKKTRGLGKKKKEAITLTTIHASKGLEWKYNWLIQADKIGGLENDGINLYYVAISRAEEELYICSTGKSDLIEISKGEVV